MTTCCEPTRAGRWPAVWCLALVLWWIPGRAGAGEPGAAPGDAPVTPPPTYEIYMTAARKLYAAQQYREAIEQFSKAYAAHPDPKIYFNLAQSFRKLGDRENALIYYEKFLQAIPGIAEFSERQKRDFTAEVRGLIQELRGGLPAGDASSPGETKSTDGDVTKPPPPVAAPVRGAGTPGLATRWWFWTGIGATALFTAGTVWAGLRTVSLNDEWEAHREVADHDRAVRWQNATDLMLLGAVVSGAAVTVGALLWSPRPPMAGGPSRAGLSPGPDGGWVLTLGWDF